MGQRKKVFRRLKENRIKFTLNTDGPEMLRTNLRNEMDFLLKEGILNRQDILSANRNAFEATFVG